MDDSATSCLRPSPSQSSRISMLKNIDPILPPELLLHLRAMGHGDELAIVDANFPASGLAQRLVRMDGLTSTRVLSAVASLLPLDTYVDAAVHVMQIVGEEGVAPIASEYRDIVVMHAGTALGNVGALERHAFYKRASKCYVVIATGETRLYGNVILTKGVIPPAC